MLGAAMIVCRFTTFTAEYQKSRDEVISCFACVKQPLRLVCILAFIAHAMA